MTTLRLCKLSLVLVVAAASVMVSALAAAGGHPAGSGVAASRHDYGDALKKILLFFEGQRSGKLPPTQRVTWRKDSALLDGHDVGVDLSGGYYDAANQVKFGFPLAFTSTMVAWSVIEFRDEIGEEECHAEEAVRWGTDYFLKATNDLPNKIYVQVGEPHADHSCWERPEDMDTPRTVYTVDTERPGSEVAAEIAAALASASIVFRTSDPDYSNKLLQRSIQVFEFAYKYQGSYNASLGDAICPYYCDYSGYEDELVWGAAWIHKASNSTWHWNYVNKNIHKLRQVGEFGWDAKFGGVFVLLYKEYLTKLGSPSDYYHKKAGEFVCTVLPESPNVQVNYSSGGLLIKPGGSNMQHTTAFSFLFVVFARYLAYADQVVTCKGGVVAPPSRLIEVAKGQADYILGDNPLGLSYMVGYGNKFPLRIHHRASSMPSLDKYPGKITCKGGFRYLRSKAPNPNLLIGALVGGPGPEVTDAYADDRNSSITSEPTTYYSAPFVGVLAYFKANPTLK